MAHCSNVKLLGDNAGCLNLYAKRQQEGDKGQGFYKIEPHTASHGCDYFLDRRFYKPEPEPKLIHNPVNWQLYREVRQ